MERGIKSCIICSRPLAADSVNGMCPGCSRTRIMPLPADTVRPVVTSGLVASVHSTPVAADALPPDPPGLKFLDQLGRGGMGVVYLAEEAVTGRRVAVKQLHAPGDPGALERFETEVRALASLNHPNIVTVYTPNFGSGNPSFSMEYVPGGTLARWVSDRGPLSPSDAATWLVAIARAAHFAHQRGIVHRDIKPGNILIADCGLRNAESAAIRNAEYGMRNEDQQTSGSDASNSAIRNPQSAIPKLSDFSLAKRTDRDDGLTAGGILGTPGFMAPEQVASEPVTPRTDVYGLGATLYHALTGHAPINADTPHELALRVLRAEPRRVRSYYPGVPLELEAIVHKCLEKDPTARYDSAAELADELDRFLAGEPVRARPLTRWRRLRRAVARNRRMMTSAAAVALALVAAVVAGAAFSGDPKATAEPQPQQPPPLESPQDRARKSMSDELAAGRTVLAIPLNGVPLWHDWARGPSALGVAVNQQNACAFQTMNESALDVCPDPMTDRYRIRAEVCQLDVTGRDAAGKLPTGGVFDAGLYIGRQTLVGKNGWRGDVSLAVRFTELPRWGLPGYARINRMVVIDDPIRRETDVSYYRYGGVPFAQTGKLPAPWRAVVVEVTPDGVKWLWENADETLVVANIPIATVQQIYAARHEALDQHAPDHGIVFPAWNPRAPIGVWSNRSAVAVRNFSITPLPRDN